MEAESRVVFDAIVSKKLVDLTEEDKAFLRARRSYLSESELKAFESVLEAEEEVEEKPKKAKKATK